MATEKNDIVMFSVEWLIIELLFWAMVFKFFFIDICRPYALKTFSNAKCFDDVKMRSGTMMKNMADEVPFLVVLGIHHVAGGLMMLYGSLAGKENIWVHGALVEAGCELIDCIFLLFDLDMWKLGAVKPELKRVLIFHHLPGLSLIIPLTLNGFHASPHLQQIGAWLLLAGGVAVLGGAFIQTLNFKTHMAYVAFAQTFVTGFIAYARMWIFPQESYQFVLELEQANVPKPLMTGCILGFCAFGIFNTVIFSLLAEKMIRYVKMASVGSSLSSSIKTNDNEEKETVPKPVMYKGIIDDEIKSE